MAHNTELDWVLEIVPPDQVALSGWNTWLDQGRPPIAYARGPCPKCEGAAQGWVPIGMAPVPEGELVTSESFEQMSTADQQAAAAIEIVVRCNCGHAHQEDGANGCGRIWGLNVVSGGSLSEPLIPTGSFRVDPLDLAAVSELDEAEKTRVATIRARAEKWIAGLTALMGLFATVLLVKGPESVTKLEGWAKFLIALAFGTALVLLILATRAAYSAAFGDPTAPENMARQPLVGVHARLLRRRRVVESKARRSLGTALTQTTWAVVFLAIGVAIAWFAPEKQPSGGSVCLKDANGVLVAKIPSTTVTLESGESLTVEPC
jgi:hypothetical protein